MEKKCDNCVNDNIGCDVIKKMRNDIFKLKVFNLDKYPVYLLIGGFIALAIVVVWSNFCSRVKANDTPVTVQLAVKEIKDLAKTDKDAIDKVLQSTAEKAFYQGRKKAQEEFDKNFTTLLTILTVFGIAWPVIIQMLQFKFNEKELEKIEIAKKQADDSLQTATSAVKNAQDSIKVLLIQYRVFSKIYYDMGLDKRQTNPGSFGSFNHYFALSLEFKLRSFMLDERNIAENSITRILSEFDFSQPSSDKNITSRNTLTTCKALAGEIWRNAIGTVREKEAEKVWQAVVTKYNQFGGSPIDGEDD